MIVSSAGDVGDCIYLLCILKNLPDGPHTLLLEPSPQTKAKGQEGVNRLYDLIGPLVSIQPYIKKCRIIKDKDRVDWQSAKFRIQHYQRGQTLMQAHLNNLIETHGIGHDINGDEAWLECEPSKESAGRIIINRTGRYRNPFFQWAQIVRHYRHRLLFVGLHHEWREFCGHFGYVEFRPTANMLEVAQLIAGCELFIGNQSCPNAIAEGLKRPLIQETDLTFPDCVYGRPDAQHVADGACTLPDIRGSGVLEVKNIRAVIQLDAHRLSESPPDGWQFEGQTGRSLRGLMRILAPIHQGKDLSALRNQVIMENIARVPQFFMRDTERQFSRVKAARKHAGAPEEQQLGRTIQYEILNS